MKISSRGEGNNLQYSGFPGVRQSFFPWIKGVCFVGNPIFLQTDKVGDIGQAFFLQANMLCDIGQGIFPRKYEVSGVG